MRVVTVFVLASLTASQAAMAQSHSAPHPWEPPSVPAAVAPSRAEAEDLYHKGMRKRRVGAGTMIAGGVLAGLGGIIVLMGWQQAKSPCNEVGCLPGFGELLIGSAFALAAVPTFFAGLAIWGDGYGLTRRAPAPNLRPRALLPFVTPLPRGGALAGLQVVGF